MVKYVNISIPEPLYTRLAKVLEGTSYRSPTEYMVYLIRNRLPNLESEDTEKRLRALGYIP